MLKLQESVTANGQLAASFLRVEGDALVLVTPAGGTEVPERVLAAVMARYGAPFDAAEPVATVATLSLGPGRTLRHVRHLAGYDVIARDYLVYEPADGEALCALSATVGRALLHLASSAPPPAGGAPSSSA